MIKLYIKEGFKLNPNTLLVQKITKRIEDNNGNCPCHNTSEDTHCPCTNYRLFNHCCCSLYVEDEEKRIES